MTAGPRSLGAVGRIPRKIRILVVLSAGLWLALPASGGPAATAGPSQARERTIYLHQPHAGEDLDEPPASGSTSGRTGWTVPRRRRRAPLRSVPRGWNGRIWGRTGCHFERRRRRPLRRPATATGAWSAGGGATSRRPWPSTTSTPSPGLDFYDVSMVDGSNLPMYIRVISRRPPTASDGRQRLPQLRPRCTNGSPLPEGVAACRAADPIRSAASRPAPASTPTAIAAAAPFAAHCSPARTWPIDYPQGLQARRALRLLVVGRRRDQRLHLQRRL